jgi:hypothetical protein
MKRFLLIAALTVGARAQEFLDKLDDRLFLEIPKINFRTDLSVLADIEGYTIDQNAPGLLFSNHDVLIQPRLSLFLDTRLGDHLYSFVQVRVDRGFDPGSSPSGAVRADEYLLRYTPFDHPWLNLQVGKFATVYGSFVARHDSWNNPFINAPLPYENITIASDQVVAGSPAAFLARKNKVDQKNIWVPILWGPSYASGASIFGTVDRFDYAFEVKNAGLSSRPAYWDFVDWSLSHPTFSGRVGYRPNAAWNIGANGSVGPYLILDPGEEKTFGVKMGDFNQITLGPDVSFAWRHWQFWGEAMASRFEVPYVGDADTLAYYLETKYKFTPELFGAVRWNQQFFEDVPNGAGGKTPWDRDMWRVDSALGYRFTRHMQAKLQYSYTHQKGPFQQGEQMAALQFTLKF